MPDISWKMDSVILGITLLIIADASSFWSANNPSGFTERRFAGEGGMVEDETKVDILYLGGGKAMVETLIVGYGGALVTGSWWPLASGMIYQAANYLWHKWHIENPHPTSTRIQG